MSQIQVIPPGKPGKKPKLNPEQTRLLASEFLKEDANRGAVARKWGMSPSGAYRAVIRFVNENPDFLDREGTPEGVPHANDNECRSHNQIDGTSPDAEGIGTFQQAA